MKNGKVLILMGGKSDSNHAGRIIEFLNKFGIPSEARIASAHKTPGKLMAILAEEEKKGEVGVFITIAGLSNALSGMVEFSTDLPVIACPPPARPSRAPMFFPRSGCPGRRGGDNPRPTERGPFRRQNSGARGAADRRKN